MEFVPYHFIVTVQWDSNPTMTSTYSAGVNLPAGKPRSEVFAEIMAAAKTKLDAPESAVILFFSLEPEDLTAAPAITGSRGQAEGG